MAADLPASTRPDPSLRLPEPDVARVFKDERLPEGLDLPAGATVPTGLSEAEAADRLRAAIAYYAASPGPQAVHRYLGPLSRAQWDHLQRIHCAHHLSFAVPR